MNMTLPSGQQEWLLAQVKAGAYDSLDDARSSIVAMRMPRERLEMESARYSTTKNADKPN